ncbi:MAG: hypothetical protein MSG64_06505 [Pyrinomonadaceae bacterium MAG19_C2-C3]|nr:hypothetical protein [Pyrinomonadaceae bacterium MAG19_C2-C3]
MKTKFVLLVIAVISMLPVASAQRRAAAVDPSGVYMTREGNGQLATAGQFGSLELTKNGSKYTGAVHITSKGIRPPVGYKFTQTSVVSNRLIATTETQGGKYYKFDGVIRGQGYNLTIDGDLTEFRSGKLFKKTRLKLSLENAVD